MNIQGVQWVDFHIRHSFSPLCKLADTVLFPHDDPNISRFWTEQTVTSASPKCGSGSDAVLHSVSKKQKQVSLPSIADQIPEQIFTRRIHQGRELLLDVGVTAQRSREYQIIPALLDSGANTTFIDVSVAKRLGLPLTPLETPIRVFNVDGSRNSAGDITHVTTIFMEYLGHHEELTAEVTNLGKNSLILGYTWLQKHNPMIDWQTGVIKFTRCPRSCLMLHNRVKRLATLDDEEREGLEYIHQAKVEAPVVKKPVRTPEELVPQCYHSYLDIFSEKATSRFPL